MDTRFWGPSGWKLLHSITFTYNPSTDRENVKEVFTMLPYVLPCKFCRASLTEYMEVNPIDSHLDSANSLSKWLWKIHNQVNAKLREQSLFVERDPPFDRVKKFYTEILNSGCSQTEFYGWEFLFSIAFLHPMSKAAKKSIPMPGAPPCETMKRPEEKNKWNCLNPEERLIFYKRFCAAIGHVLPFLEWRSSWLKNPVPDLDSRDITVKWLWNTRCRMETDLNLLNRCKYSYLCKTLKSHRSGCSSSRRARTCRKRKQN